MNSPAGADHQDRTGTLDPGRTRCVHDASPDWFGLRSSLDLGRHGPLRLDRLFLKDNGASRSTWGHGGCRDRIGTLGIGREADVTVLAFDETDIELEDCIGQMRSAERRLAAIAVWRAGEPSEITSPGHFPNQAQIAKGRALAPKALVRD